MIQGSISIITLFFIPLTHARTHPPMHVERLKKNMVIVCWGGVEGRVLRGFFFFSFFSAC